MLFLTAAELSAATLYLDWKSVCMRLLCAMVVGMVIGTEREYTHRPAGMRTHILVALGACAVMVTGQQIFAEYRPYGGAPDPARLAAQVITGVGFLGAGTILREGANVKGLTTAASLWSVACLGIAAGGGYYAIALIGMLFIFITLTFFEWLQHKLIKPKVSRRYSVDVTDATTALQDIGVLADKHKAQISELRAEARDVGFLISFHAEFGRGNNHPRKFFEGLTQSEAVRVVSIVDEAAAILK